MSSQERRQPTDEELVRFNLERFVSRGIIQSFRDHFKGPDDLPPQYLPLDWEQLERGTLDITRRDPARHLEERVVVRSGTILYEEKRKWRRIKRFKNSVDAIERVERFMDRLIPDDYPQEPPEWWEKLK